MITLNKKSVMFPLCKTSPSIMQFIEQYFDMRKQVYKYIFIHWLIFSCIG